MHKRLRTWGRRLLAWLKMASKQEKEREILRQCFAAHPKAFEILCETYRYTTMEIAQVEGEKMTGFRLGRQSVVEELNRVMEKVG
jgi:hypothetical protein